MSGINPSIFKAYDIRGIVETDLTPNTVERIGQSFASESLQGSYSLSIPSPNRELCKSTDKVENTGT